MLYTPGRIKSEEIVTGLEYLKSAFSILWIRVVFEVDDEINLKEAIQGLPPDPVDDEMSTLTSAHDPTTSGTFRATFGKIESTGPNIEITDVEFFQEEHG
jgi:hypothetical protein